MKLKTNRKGSGVAGKSSAKLQGALESMGDRSIGEGDIDGIQNLIQEGYTSRAARRGIKRLVKQKNRRDARCQ